MHSLMPPIRAALQFPEHTREAYEAGARMGAGIVECDGLRLLSARQRDFKLLGGRERIDLMRRLIVVGEDDVTALRHDRNHG